MCRIIIIAIISVVVVANALQVRGRYESGKQMTDGCKYASVCVCETCTVFVCARKLNGLLIALSHMPEPAGRAAHARLSQANRILNESLFLCVFCYFSYNTHIWFSFA